MYCKLLPGELSGQYAKESSGYIGPLAEGEQVILRPGPLLIVQPSKAKRCGSSPVRIKASALFVVIWSGSFPFWFPPQLKSSPFSMPNGRPPPGPSSLSTRKSGKVKTATEFGWLASVR